MNKPIINNVTPCQVEGEVGGSRWGEVWCSRAELEAICGPPVWEENYQDYTENKVTVIWQLKTPRGLVAIRDYWWNKKGKEWSIGAANHKAALWAINFCRIKLREVRNDNN